VGHIGFLATAKFMWRGRGAVHEIWLSEGLGYTRENACPFCGQTVDGAVALIGAYKAYFGGVV
jgi:wobble nucleotide-excising tRNase